MCSVATGAFVSCALDSCLLGESSVDVLVFSVCQQFSGFSSDSLAERILDSKAKVLITAGKTLVICLSFAGTPNTDEQVFFCLLVIANCFLLLFVCTTALHFHVPSTL